MAKESYMLALGSNRRHHRHGHPRQVIAAAISALEQIKGITVESIAPVFETVAVGLRGRTFANGAVRLKSKKEPHEVLKIAKKIEQDFGRRRGRRWGTRVIDIDIILWSGGIWADGRLLVPHPEYRQRRFVLDPLLKIAADWRDPLTGLKVRHLHARLFRPNPVDRRGTAA
jgi:2-amino-4-hydroxy-6-hydroxymethyldihydropteridine diphosphokinase